MTIGKYTLEVDDRGLIKITPKADFYFSVGAEVANALAESGTTEWHEICLKTMNIMSNNSVRLKSEIMAEMSYGSNFHSIRGEGVRGKKFEEVKAFVEGYNEAVEQFKSIFEGADEGLRFALNKILPSN